MAPKEVKKPPKKGGTDSGLFVVREPIQFPTNPVFSNIINDIAFSLGPKLPVFDPEEVNVC